MKLDWDKLSSFVKLFIPEFSNKVTWAVIAAGLALTSTSLLEGVLFAFIKEKYNIEIFSSYDSVVGVLLVILALVHNILLQREKTKITISTKLAVDNTAAIEHDKEIFFKLDKMLPEEQLMGFIDYLETSHSYNYFSYNDLEKFKLEIEKTKNSFSLSSIDEKLNALKKAAQSFEEFLLNNFDHYGACNDTLYLKPYWNCDRGGQLGNHEHDIKYSEVQKALFERTEAYQKAYIDFRKSVTVNLAI